MAFPKRWPDTEAEWTKPEDWSMPGSRERVDLLDPGPLKPGDFVELRDGRRMQVVIRYLRRGGSDAEPIQTLGLIDA